jgi:putative ABC transport system substrate-binding protein
MYADYLDPRGGSMSRREFITLLGGAAVAWPLGALAQQRERMRRIGIVMPYAETDSEYQAHVRAFREELRKRGWSDANIRIDVRWTSDDLGQVRSSAQELLEAKSELLVAIGGRVIPILMQLTHDVPIVVPGAADPVEIGWVQSLARPGGNVTGFTFLELSILGKMLDLLKQIAPGTTRVVMPYNPDNPSTVVWRRAFAGFAARLSVEPVTIPVHGLAEIERGIDAFADLRGVGLLVPPDITLNAIREALVGLLARRHIPAVYPQVAYTRIGGLMYYGADRIDLWRRSAEYVDRILRGERPGDLPFQQPTQYQLIINVRAARLLGLAVPPTLLAIADEVID